MKITEQHINTSSSQSASQSMMDIVMMMMDQQVCSKFVSGCIVMYLNQLSSIDIEILSMARRKFMLSILLIVKIKLNDESTVFTSLHDSNNKLN